jgi:hypothetical protein
MILFFYWVIKLIREFIMQTKPWPINNYYLALFLPDQKFFDEIDQAKDLDKMCVRDHNQSDKDYHLVSVQIQHERKGKIILLIHTNIYGFNVRNTNNFGNQNYVGRGATAKECLNFCKKWYLEDPTNRGIIFSEFDYNHEPQLKRAVDELE